jgi:hypothetical protein
MDEYLLTKEEIAHIVNKAAYSLLNNPGFVGQFTKHRWDIFSISWQKKLFFIKGDQFTGLEHINIRHRFFTNGYSQTSNSMFLPTSKFDKDGGVLSDYIKIAETLFEPAYIDSKNTNPEQFDVFKGNVALNTMRQYRLILYKDTRIVHTLFPIDKKKPRKLRKGEVLVNPIGANTLFLTIPYYDIDDTIRYGIGFKHLIDVQEEDVFILVFENGRVVKQIVLPKRKVKYRYGLNAYIQSLNYLNVSNVEDVIAKVEKGQIK